MKNRIRAFALAAIASAELGAAHLPFAAGSSISPIQDIVEVPLGPWYISLSAHQPRVNLVHNRYGRPQNEHFDLTVMCWRDTETLLVTLQAKRALTELDLPTQPGSSARGSMKLPSAEKRKVEWVLTDDGYFQTDIDPDELILGMTAGRLDVSLDSTEGGELSDTFIVPPDIGIDKKVGLLLEACSYGK